MRFRPRFLLGGQKTWLRQRDSRLSITGFLAAVQFLEIDRHVVPAMRQPMSLSASIFFPR